ncbi:hypothetical protein THIX_10031 [Thiomonas sp. X19]|nr:hypothetical protein THIX_10031 [Thiomonas sp. X19]
MTVSEKYCHDNEFKTQEESP